MTGLKPGQSFPLKTDIPTEVKKIHSHIFSLWLFFKFKFTELVAPPLNSSMPLWEGAALVLGTTALDGATEVGFSCQIQRP